MKTKLFAIIQMHIKLCEMMYQEFLERINNEGKTRGEG